MNEIRDWRQVPVNIGDTVLYATSQSNSVTINEGKVIAFTDSGKFKVELVRTSGYLWGEFQKIRTVGPQNLTVIGHLPDTRVPHAAEQQKLREAGVAPKRGELW